MKRRHVLALQHVDRGGGIIAMSAGIVQTARRLHQCHRDCTGLPEGGERGARAACPSTATLRGLLRSSLLPTPVRPGHCGSLCIRHLCLRWKAGDPIRLHRARTGHGTRYPVRPARCRLRDRDARIFETHRSIAASPRIRRSRLRHARRTAAACVPAKHRPRLSLYWNRRSGKRASIKEASAFPSSGRLPWLRTRRTALPGSTT